jgi:DNA-binding response OmpR family regulator
MSAVLQNLPYVENGPEGFSVFLITTDAQDPASLRRVLPRGQWRIITCGSVSDAAAKIDVASPSVVLCESDLPEGNWKHVLSLLQAKDAPPPLLVISRHADERLWAEVLNLGGYDVLLKPFDPSEVTRVLAMARRFSLAHNPAPSPSVTDLQYVRS